MAIQIGILGPVEARQDGVLLDIPAGKQRALLALLAVHAPHPVTADRVAEALWPEADPASAARSVQVTVSRLRQRLAGIETVAAGYRLAVPAEAIDARRFERAVGRARGEHDDAEALQLLDAALALWRGAALADVAFESFAQGEIGRLEELRLLALEQRAELRIARGDHALVVPELEQLAAEHPARERLLGLLMTALYRCGRQADALSVFEHGRRRLDEELGLQPSRDLQRLQTQILRQDAALDGAPGGIVALLCAELDGAPSDPVSEAVERAGGRLQAGSDATVRAIFATPGAAAEAAVAVQRAAPGARVGLHAGPVRPAAGGYGGIELHVAARVAGAANPGQIVVSEAARGLLDARHVLADLGEHRLAGVPDAGRLWMLVHDGRGAHEFPPLRAEPVRPTNLPPDPRPILGRDAEIAAVARLLTGDARLVTVVGLGGSGKTRLALAVAERLLSAFAGGVWLVPLAGVHDPEALAGEIAAAVGAGDEAALARRLRARPTLLVLDNFEQLVAAAPALDALLQRSPGTRALVTSQLPLRVAGERVMRLPPLADADAVRLFTERARAAAPDFDPLRDAAAVQEICARVDGMPLAIELAAARVATIAPDDLLRRMERSLHVLARGPRDLPERQRSLHATLAWTHELLEADERTLLARLAAFVGPAPLDAVEAIAAVAARHGPVDAVDALGGLVDASFVQRDESREHGIRYTLAQAVRDFAADQLRASGEEHAIRRAHGAHLAALGAACRGVGDHDDVRARVFALDAEFRPALAWARAHDPPLHTRVALALAVSLVDVGRALSAYDELTHVLARSDPATMEWGKASLLAAYTAIGTSRAGEIPERVKRGLAVLRGASDEELWVGLWLADMSRALSGDMEGALVHALEMVENARRRPRIADLAASLVTCAHTLVHCGRLDEAERLLEEAEPLLPVVGDSALDTSDIHADLAAERGEWVRAAALYARSALVMTQLQTDRAWALRRAAVCFAHAGADEAALEIAAATAEIMAEFEAELSDFWVEKYGAALGAAAARVAPDRAAAAAERGRALTPLACAERAVELAGEA